MAFRLVYQSIWGKTTKFFQSEALLFSRDDCDSYNPFLNDEVGTFCEHIRLANKVALIIRDLQRGQKEESAVDVKDRLFHSINRGSISSEFNKAKNIWDDKHTICSSVLLDEDTIP